jgi:hypothetical protein
MIEANRYLFGSCRSDCRFLNRNDSDRIFLSCPLSLKIRRIFSASLITGE